jgi:hypothetical protein
MLAATETQSGCPGLIGLGADAEVGVGFGMDYAAGWTYDIRCRQR